MDTREIECFVRTYEAGSITKAARELYISPQGLSKMLAKIEAEVGATLLVRTHHGVSLTDAGQVFYRQSSRLLDDFDKLRSSLTSSVPTKDPLSVVTGLGVRSFLGYEMNDAFRTEHPEILLDAEEHPDATVYHLLEKGEADVGVVPGPPDPIKFASELVASIPHVAIVREDDPVAKRGIARYKDFEGRRLVMVSRRFKPLDNVMGKLAKHRVTVEGLEEAGEILKVSQIVRRMGGIGISVLSEARDYTYPGTKAVPLEDPDLTWDLYLASPADGSLSPSARDFCRFVRSWCSSGRPEFSDCNVLLV